VNLLQRTISIYVILPFIEPGLTSVMFVQLVLPFIELALSRLQRPIQMVSLRTSLINIIMAALLHNPPLVIALLDRPLTGATCSILTDVTRHWLGDHRGLLGSVFTWSPIQGERSIAIVMFLYLCVCIYVCMYVVL